MGLDHVQATMPPGRERDARRFYGTCWGCQRGSVGNRLELIDARDAGFTNPATRRG